MSFIKSVRALTESGTLPRIFSASDVKRATGDSNSYTLANYDTKNAGSSNKNTKVLESRKIAGTKYYTFKN